MFEFLITPPVGTVMLLDAQPYRVVAIAPHTRRDGTPSNVITWEAHCAACGSVFVVTSGLKSGSIARRCMEHRNPVRPVGKRGARVTVKVIEPGEKAGG